MPVVINGDRESGGVSRRYLLIAIGIDPADDDAVLQRQIDFRAFGRLETGIDLAADRR